MEEDKIILVHDCIFQVEDENGNTTLYRAPKIDFSHIAEYVDFDDLVEIKDEKSPSDV